MESSCLDEFCNLMFEWKAKKICVDTANKKQLAQLQKVREKAIQQSGLTPNELLLISNCRIHGTFVKVNTFSKSLKSL